MNARVGELGQIVDAWAPRLTGISEADASRKPSPERWSKKEILGHLIDSAGNNHQRFVRGQLVQPVALPDYEQNGWVRVQAYADEAWPDIVALWVAFNRHLLHVLRAMPDAMYENRITFGPKTITIAEVLDGYLKHLLHHLDQLIER